MPERTRKTSLGNEERAGATRRVIRGAGDPPLPRGVAVDVAIRWSSRLARYEDRQAAVAATAGAAELRSEPTPMLALPTEARMRLVSSQPLQAEQRELPRSRCVTRVDMAPARSRRDQGRRDP